MNKESHCSYACLIAAAACCHEDELQHRWRRRCRNATPSRNEPHEQPNVRLPRPFNKNTMIRGIVSSLRTCTSRTNSTQNQKDLFWKISPWNTRRPFNIVGDKPTTYSCIQHWIAKNIKTLQRHLSQQCEFIVAQRVRRAYQIWALYSQIYSDKTFRAMVSQFHRRLATKKRPLGLLLGTATAAFNWEKENITDEEMAKCACDLEIVERLLGTKLTHGGSPRLTTAVCQEEGTWEFVINKEDLKVWRKSVDKSYLYEYKVFGTFYDIPARVFFRVQVDTEYRKKWDSLVIKLNIIDTKQHSNQSHSEVVHWVTHYPYPMYSRDYVYVRRFMIDDKLKLMYTVSRSIDHPDVPLEKNSVRVQRYRSQFCVRPHEDFDKNGLDYVLTYFDDPQAAFPAPAYSWMTTSGVSDFVNKLHSAAVCLHRSETAPPQRKRSRNKQGGWLPSRQN